MNQMWFIAGGLILDGGGLQATLRKRALHSESAQTLKMIGRLWQLASSIPAAIGG
jgi:hypothetical protein